ncbi:hypothetical protein SAMN04489740_1828 [Arthrobacter alpinus]|uniref:Uncharacterized protein n=1 Tax=Arthrobacter alpinus TaxID=656366 RepID=A0A1H5K0L5_9MICC|nr:hypothetical protein SAMN04489740_1828 [Arthrobacter alpinus]
MARLINCPLKEALFLRTTQEQGLFHAITIEVSALVVVALVFQLLNIAGNVGAVFRTCL